MTDLKTMKELEKTNKLLILLIDVVLQTHDYVDLFDIKKQLDKLR